MKLITRDQWGARRSRGATVLRRTRGVKVHYTGDPEPLAMTDDHQVCYRRVRSIQDSHMDSRGWNDIGYSAVACLHGYVFEGRGPGILPAANGAGLNSGHYAVCGLVGRSGVTAPTDPMKRAIRDAVAWLRAEGNAGPEIKGHRDGYPTDCPGAQLYAWVEGGAPVPGAPAPGNDDQGEDMPRYLSLTRTADLELQPGEWTTIPWDGEASDGGDQHEPGKPGFIRGPAVYSLSASFRLAAFGAGHQGQIRALELDPRKPAAVSAGQIHEWVSTDGDSFPDYVLGADKVGEGRGVQLQIVQFGPVPVKLLSASVKAMVWA